METELKLVEEFVGEHWPRVLGAVVILLLGWLVSKLLTRGLRRVLTTAGLDRSLVGFGSRLVYVGLMALVVISALDKLGVPTTSFFAALGAAGLAVGLALKDSLSHFASGVMLILFRPFKVGDQVEVAGVKGTVEEIRVFATLLRSEDSKRITVPNAVITGRHITNLSNRSSS